MEAVFKPSPKGSMSSLLYISLATYATWGYFHGVGHSPPWLEGRWTLISSRFLVINHHLKGWEGLKWPSKNVNIWIKKKQHHVLFIGTPSLLCHKNKLINFSKGLNHCCSNHYIFNLFGRWKRKPSDPNHPSQNKIYTRLMMTNQCF